MRENINDVARGLEDRLFACLILLECLIGKLPWAGMKDKRVGQQWHRITGRVLSDLQHRSTLRTAPTCSTRRSAL